MCEFSDPMVLLQNIQLWLWYAKTQQVEAETGLWFEKWAESKGWEILVELNKSDGLKTDWVDG